MQMLQRRHELRAVLKCYTRLSLVRVLPQAALLAMGELLIAVLARDRDRARAVMGAWRWNARHLTELSVLRGELAEHRLFPDAEVRRMQVRGSARLSRYLSRLSYQGLEAANAVTSGRVRPAEDERAEVAVLTGSVGSAFSEDSDFDELDDLGRRAGRDRFGRRVRRPPLGTGRQRVLAMVIAVVVIVVGTRGLLLRGPSSGRPAGAASVVDHDVAPLRLRLAVGRGGHHRTSVPCIRRRRHHGHGVLRRHGDGAAGLASRLHSAGRVGVSRFMRPLVSPRARVIAVICYLGLPLPYGALGTGRWDGLVAYAAFPFIALRLARAAAVEPYVIAPSTQWRDRPGGQVAALGAIIAVAAGFAPAVVPLVLLLALAWSVGSVLIGAPDARWRVLLVAVEAVGVALLLTLPWVVGTALAGKASVGIFGLPLAGSTSPGWGELIRFAVGPAARSPLAWLLVVAAALPLLLGRGTRLVWATRLWVTALGSWGLAFAAYRGDMGSFAPSETVVLAPAALAVAACVGLAISAFETDLAESEFGWRQLVGAAALVLVVVGLLPVAAAAGGGRWDLPSQGVEQPLGFLSRQSQSVARVLWLGDPRALPVGGWSVEPGLAFSLTPEDLPDTAQVLAPAGSGPAALTKDAVKLALSGGTVHLGRLLAPAGVRYVVLVDGLAPSLVGQAVPAVSAPPPPGVQQDLFEQNDLQVVPGEVGRPGVPDRR